MALQMMEGIGDINLKIYEDEEIDRQNVCLQGITALQ